jgi:cobyrinic acid a,c-diamide synthase
VAFDPLRDPRLPDGVTGLYVGGGFPEVFVDALADNVQLLEDVARRAGRDVVTWAECGGLLWLCRALEHRALAGVVPASAHMGERPVLGYREVAVGVASPIAAVGGTIRGHEFHYSRLDDQGDCFGVARDATRVAAFSSPRLLATYLHVHLGASPAMAERFVATCAAREAER